MRIYVTCSETKYVHLILRNKIWVKYSMHSQVNFQLLSKDNDVTSSKKVPNKQRKTQLKLGL